MSGALSRPPLIGITAGNDPRFPGHYLLRWDYIYGVNEAGGIPVILAPGKASRFPTYSENFAGLIFSGGYDLTPRIYGQEAHPSLSHTSWERDEFEMTLMRSALLRGVPILGICRGMQVLNVALGGTLVQDLPNTPRNGVLHDDPKRPRDVLAHEVAIHSDSRLCQITGRSRMAVNSFHHQAVDRIGEGLRKVAFAADGVVEALEMPGSSFAVGVQWHPETFWDQGAPFLNFFQALVHAAQEFQENLPERKRTPDRGRLAGT
ncbi:MAG: gamma-glutamyl-gamma-aminobutyrate hydrolase family protein [Planctomycetota bacterium]|nr:MAG: gamma-glutamyl-gamma-aminobutyrate hydrolase family protein [Planctomycetota bacterium]